MKKLLKLACLFLCLLIIGTFTVACGGGGGGSSSGGGFGYFPTHPDTNGNGNNGNNTNPIINPTNKTVTLNDEILQQLYELGIINSADKNKLTSIDIPATYTYNGTNYQITAIADKLFYNCVNLKKAGQSFLSDIRRNRRTLGLLILRSCFLATVSFAFGLLLRTIFKN